MKKIYFDYAASTPVDIKVKLAMTPYFRKYYGNAGSLHFFGQVAMAAVDKARQAISRVVGADFREIVFAGSATEANNLALRGILKDSAKERIIVSAIEHESVLETARALERGGAEVIYLPVNKKGLVNLKELRDALNKETVLVSVMYANNEIGTIQPIKEISGIIKGFDPGILLHTDAVQAFQFLDCNVKELGVDLMTLSAHKIYGPKGIGLLYVRGGGKNLKPIITGGGQESGLRSGSENVPSIVGFGEAVRLAEENRQKESRRIRELRDYFWQELKKICSEAELNNSLENSLPNILNVYFPGFKSGELLIKLDQLGVAVSSGSACSVRSSKPSHVLKALGLSIERIKSSLRFSFGKFTSEKEIKESIKIIGRLTKKGQVLK